MGEYHDWREPILVTSKNRVMVDVPVTKIEADAIRSYYTGMEKIIRVPSHLIQHIRLEGRFDERVLINGEPKIGEGTRIGIFSEVYDKGGVVTIGKSCDVASFVAINCADSHRRCLGETDSVDLRPITIGDNVFIGSHCFIGGGTTIGHHSVIGAGVSLIQANIPPHTLVYNGLTDLCFHMGGEEQRANCVRRLIIKKGYYKPK